MSSDDLLLKKLEALKRHAEGANVVEIARATMLSPSTIYALIKAGHCRPLQRAGRKPGQGSSLSPEQERSARVEIRERAPRLVGVKPNGTWTWGLVSQLIEKQTGNRLSRRAVGNYLASWGIQVNPTGERQTDRCIEAIRNWWATSEATIRGEAEQRELARVLWLNRPVVLGAQPWHHPERRPRCKTLHLLSAETGRGALYWRLYRATDEGQEVNFLSSLHRHVGRNLILIRRTNTSFHRPEVVRLVSDLRGAIEIRPRRDELGPQG